MVSLLVAWKQRSFLFPKSSKYQRNRTKHEFSRPPFLQKISCLVADRTAQNYIVQPTFLSLLRLYVLVLFVPSPQPIISSSALIAQWGRPGPGEEVLIRSCASLRRQRPLEWGLLAFKPLSQRFWPFLFFSLSLVSWLVICLFVTKSHSFGHFKSVICPIGPPKGGMCRSSRSSSRACHFTILPFLFFGGNSECGHAPE